MEVIAIIGILVIIGTTAEVVVKPLIKGEFAIDAPADSKADQQHRELVQAIKESK